jgi:serine protease Do
MKLLSALFALTLWPSPGATMVERPLLVALSASVLKVEAQRAQGGFSVGSGVVIAPDRIVTNCHVTRDAVVIHVLRGGARWQADAQASQPDLDLCVLRVPGMRGVPVELGDSARLVPGDAVAALGFTGGVGLQVSDGEVIALHRHAGGNVVQSSNWFTSGASGGGLFDERSQLVGILTYRLRGGAAHYFSAPSSWLLPLISESANYRPIAPLDDAPLAYWQRPLPSQPRFLQAAAMAQAQQWPELLQLSTGWAAEDSQDAEPWFLRGLSLVHLKQLEDAQASLETAVQHEPSCLPAWHRLGLVLIQRGRLSDARAALSHLNGRQADLADDLQQALSRACALFHKSPECSQEPA